MEALPWQLGEDVLDAVFKSVGGLNYSVENNEFIFECIFETTIASFTFFLK